MALSELYPKDLESLYPTSTDAYLSDLPHELTHNSGVELGKKPPVAIDQILDITEDGLRRIEVLRKQLAYYASVAHELTKQEGWSDKLSDEQVAKVRALAALRSADT